VHNRFKLNIINLENIMHQNQLITMTNKEAKRYEIIKDLLAKKIDGTEASKLLGLCVRQVKRIKASVKNIGIAVVIHGNRNKKSNRKTSEEITKNTKEHLHKTYHDFNPLLVKEKLLELNKIDLSKESLT